MLVRRLEAERNGDREAMAKIDEDLRALEGPKLAFGTTLYKAAPSVPKEKSQQERLGDLNRANRKANTENVRKAQLAEQKAKRLHRAAVERGEAVADPFSRVKIVPKTHFDVNNPYAVSKPKAIAKKPTTPSSPASSVHSLPVKQELSPLYQRYLRYDIHLGGVQQPKFLRHVVCNDELLGHIDLGLNVNVF